LRDKDDKEEQMTITTLMGGQQQQWRDNNNEDAQWGQGTTTTRKNKQGTTAMMGDNSDYNEGQQGTMKTMTGDNGNYNEGQQWQQGPIWDNSDNEWQWPLPTSSVGGLFNSFDMFTNWPPPLHFCEVGGISFFFIVLHTYLLTGPCLWGVLLIVLISM
jgi:hypothetical protein